MVPGPKEGQNYARLALEISSAGLVTQRLVSGPLRGLWRELEISNNGGR
jgi:hypothetical protein